MALFNKDIPGRFHLQRIKNLPRFVSAVCVSVWHFQTPVRRKSTFFLVCFMDLQKGGISILEELHYLGAADTDSC